MRDSADSGRAMNGNAGVVVIGHVRFARVQADADGDASFVRPPILAERALSSDCGLDRVARATKDDEEGIASRSNLNAAVCCEYPSQQVVVRGEHLGIALLQPLDELGRAFDVGEEKRHGPTRKVGMPGGIFAAPTSPAQTREAPHGAVASKNASPSVRTPHRPARRPPRERSCDGRRGARRESR